MRDLAQIGRFRMAHDWPLIAALLALLLAAGIGVADALYRHDGTVVYPSMLFINYTLRGVGPQIPWLAVAAVTFLLMWVGLRRGRRDWLAIGLVLLVVAGIGLLAARSLHHPLASVFMSDRAYHASVMTPTHRSPELYLLFQCEPAGIICHQVAAFAPFDRATGRHVAGPLTLLADPATHVVTLRIAGYAIGTYHPA